jgi:4-amino-4-deoxy-L-arabinose transferase-like glycosyltransferase
MLAPVRRIAPTDALLVTAFTLVGLAIRVPLLGRSIWRDEGSTYAVVATPSLHGLLSHVWTTEMTPPLYYLIEYWWTHLAGVSEAAMRAPSLLFGLVAILVMYALGRRVAGTTGAIAAAFCATFSPLAIELDVEARAYAFALLLSAAFLYSYAVCVTSAAARRGWYVALFISGVLLTATFTTGYVVLAVVTTAAVATAAIRRNRESAILALTAVGTCLVSLAFIPYVLHYAANWRGCCVQSPDLNLRIDRNLEAFSPFGIMYDQLNAALKIAVGLWLVTLPFRRRDVVDGLIATAAGIVALGIAASIVENVSPERHLLVYAPAAWLLMAMFIARFITWLGRTRSLRWVVALPVAYGLFCALLHYPKGYLAGTAAPSDVRAAVAALAPFRGHTLLVIAAPDYLGATLNYYFRSTPGVTLRGIATWEKPQFYKYDLTPWEAKNFTRNEVDRVEQLARKQNALIVLVDRPRANTFNGVPFARALWVVGPLKRENHLLYERSFPSLREAVNVTVLQSPSGRPLAAKGYTEARY